MVSEKSKYNSQIELEDADKARLFLALSSHEQSTQDIGDCPDNEQLSLFMQNRISSDQRRFLLKHIDNCPTCFEKLRHLPQPDVQKNNAFSFTIAVESFIEGIIEWIQNTFFRPRYILIPALAVATCILLIIITKQYDTKDFKLNINQSYETVISQSVQRENIEKIKFPWEYQQKAIISSSVISPEKKAFVAGLLYGRKALNSSMETYSHDFLEQWKNPEDTHLKEWHIYYWIGKWAVLIQSLKYSAIIFPETFWHDQMTILKNMLNHLSKTDHKDTDLITSSLRTIQQYIHSQKHENQLVEQKKIAQQVSYFIERFCPKQLEFK